MAKIGMHRNSGVFLVDTPANVLRGLETTPYATVAKKDFTDQTSVDSFVTARTSPALSAGTFLLVDLGAAGIQL